jgi:hypothetical protein
MKSVCPAVVRLADRQILPPSQEIKEAILSQMGLILLLSQDESPEIDSKSIHSFTQKQVGFELQNRRQMRMLSHLVLQKHLSQKVLDRIDEISSETDTMYTKDEPTITFLGTSSTKTTLLRGASAIFVSM